MADLNTLLNQLTQVLHRLQNLQATTELSPEQHRLMANLQSTKKLVKQTLAGNFDRCNVQVQLELLLDAISPSTLLASQPLTMKDLLLEPTNRLDHL